MVDLFENDSWHQVIETFKSISKKYDEKCFERKRVLDSFLLVIMIIKMVQARNSQGYAITINDFWLKAKKFVPKLSVLPPVSQSSFSDARSKLDPLIFKEINTSLVKKSNQNRYLWHGHRVFAVDGSKINLPRPLLEEGFALPNPQAYYPQGMISSLYDLKAKVPYDFFLTNDGDERACAFKHLEQLSPGDIVVYDRGYHCYGLLYKHINSRIHTVMRMETTTTFNIVKKFANSNSNDKIVEFTPAEGSVGKIRKSFPNLEIKKITLRLIKYTIKDVTYVLATTLLDKSKYPRKIFVDLYHSRWGVEEMYKTLKSTLDTTDFHGKSRKKVEQELFAGFLLMTLARLFANSTKVEAMAKKKSTFR